MNGFPDAGAEVLGFLFGARAFVVSGLTYLGTAPIY